MNRITAYFWCGLYQGFYLDTSLKKLVANYQAHVPGADHNGPLAWNHPVHVYQCLCSSCTHYAGERPARKSQGVFYGPRGQDQALSLQLQAVTPVDDGQGLPVKQTPYHGVQHHFDTGFFGFLQKLSAYVDASHSRLVRFRAEELVYLLEELSSGASVLVYESDFQSVSGPLYGGAQSGRAGADDRQLNRSQS